MMVSPLLIPPCTPPERFVVGADLAFPNLERIVVLRAFHRRGGEAGADLETFRRRQAEHRLGQIGLELVEDRFARDRAARRG